MHQKKKSMCGIKPCFVFYTPKYYGSIAVLHKRLKTTADIPFPLGRVVNDLNDEASTTVSTARPPPPPAGKR